MRTNLNKSVNEVKLKEFNFLNRIWDFLVDQSTRLNTTIIITTHYIEEARRADLVGFMRNGKIIEENSPEFLMRKYNQLVTLDPSPLIR